MFNLRFRTNKLFVLTSFALNVERTREKYKNKSLLAHCQRVSEFAGLSVADLLLTTDDPLSSLVYREQFRREIDRIAGFSETSSMLHESVLFQSTVKHQWALNRKQIADELGQMLRIPLPRTRVNVFTTHPEIPTGYAVPQLRAICWGHYEDFKNYHSVYLTHELLHFVLPFDSREIGHALIELIADDELRIRINRTGRYFQYPGHARLLPLKRKLLPHWNRYLGRRTGNIRKLLQECQKAI